MLQNKGHMGLTPIFSSNSDRNFFYQDLVETNIMKEIQPRDFNIIDHKNNFKKLYPNIIKNIRGKGLLIGIQLHTDQTKFIKKLMDNKLLTIRAAENVVRILPPLNVKKNEVDQALKIINKVCKELN